mgnify:CR=1 FL=1
MTKKDYVAIAQWLRVHDIPRILDKHCNGPALDYLIKVVLEKDNPKFDERRFRKYIWAEIDTEGLLLDLY